MEGDYYDYEKNLSRSFDSEPNARQRKRQRLEATNHHNAEFKPSPLSAERSASAKGRSAFHDNYYSDEVEDASPAYPPYHSHQFYINHNPERTPGDHRPYPDPSYKGPPFSHPYGGEHPALHSHVPSSPAADMNNGHAKHPPYYYDQSQYAPQWDPYSYHHQYQQFHPSQPWNNYATTPRYHPSNGNSPNTNNNQEGYPPRPLLDTAKDERPPEYFPHAAAYPYYYPNYPVNYPPPQPPFAHPGPNQQQQHDPNHYHKRPAPNALYPALPTHSAEMPVQRTMSLFMACDEDRLSEYQCLARKQIEVFSATYTDLKMTVQGRNRQVMPGQVGIRCRFCAHIPVKKQARASVYYPSKLECIYQAAQNMASVHLAKYCPFVPEDIRNELVRHMKDRKSSAGGGKEYWAVSARSLGIEECDGRLRFASHMNDDSARGG